MSGEDLIDAKVLGSSFTVEELADKAEELVRSMSDHSALLAKPSSNLREAQEVYACFGMLLGGLAPLPGMTVLDFGAGSGWTSHYLAQLGCQVIALDVSAAMLELTATRFERQPLFGVRPEPTFLHFDGHHFDLDDDSVDRIFCFDALHHVPNVADVIAEMARVLRPGGVAGFSEAGPNHSRHAQSQHEMRRYGVPEFDIVLEDVWSMARRAGFAELSVALFSPAPQWVPLDRFTSFLADPAPAGRRSSLVRAARRGFDRFRGTDRPDNESALLDHARHVQGVLENRRMFLMRTAGTETTDSREVTGLAADLVLSELTVTTGPSRTAVSGRCTIRNTGRNRWLPSSAATGAVRLGLRVGQGPHPSDDHGRVHLPGETGVRPGETVVVDFTTEVPTPGPGQAPGRLELDLVSDGIIWFAEVQGRPVEVPIPPADSRPG